MDQPSIHSQPTSIHHHFNHYEQPTAMTSSILKPCSKTAHVRKGLAKIIDVAVANSCSHLAFPCGLPDREAIKFIDGFYGVMHGGTYSPSRFIAVVNWDRRFLGTPFWDHNGE